MLDRIKPGGAVSIEKDIFPKMARDGQLHGTPLVGFWADVGQPKDFLTGSKLYLESLNSKNSPLLSKEDYVTGNVLIDPLAKIGSG
jgi:mannose-1-phosphate guanylyltransferase